jgi:hypothetical protein
MSKNEQDETKSIADIMLKPVVCAFNLNVLKVIPCNDGYGFNRMIVIDSSDPADRHPDSVCTSITIIQSTLEFTKAVTASFVLKTEVDKMKAGRISYEEIERDYVAVAQPWIQY